MINQLPRKQIGSFIVQEMIGRGVMSTVYQAFQSSVNRSVAIKVIDFSSNPLARANFHDHFSDAAKSIIALEHLHILPVYDYGILDEAAAYIVMRLVNTGSVDQLLSRGEHIDFGRAMRIFSQTARALAYAHQRGIIHRDLKPSNILLDHVDNAYISDFGLGKLSEISLDLTIAGSVSGVLTYASPEQLRGEAIDHRSDIYSMSAILYHMLTGRPPFVLEAESIAELITRKVHHPPPSLRQYNPDIPPDVEMLILKGLSQNPNERFDNIETMTAALNRAFGFVTNTGIMPTVRKPKPRQRRSVSWLIIGMIMIIALAGFGMIQRGVFSPAVVNGTVMVNATGTAEDARPTSAEIRAAQARLGDDGFIAYITCTLESEFQASRARMTRDVAHEYDIPLRVYDSELDRYQQVTLIERARLDGAKAIILCPLDSSVLNPQLEDLQRAQIPVIYTTPYDPPFGGVIMDTDNYELGYRAGYLAGQLLQIEKGGRGNVVLLTYQPPSPNMQRVDGMEAGVLAAAPQANILGRFAGPGKDDGEHHVATLLADGVELDAIVSVNDAMALGAVHALEAAQIAPDEVIITSINAESLAMQYVQRGYYLRGTIQVNREESSRMSVEAAIRLLGGGSVPQVLKYNPGELITQDWFEQ